MGTSLEETKVCCYTEHNENDEIVFQLTLLNGSGEHVTSCCRRGSVPVHWGRPLRGSFGGASHRLFAGLVAGLSLLPYYSQPCPYCQGCPYGLDCWS